MAVYNGMLYQYIYNTKDVSKTEQQWRILLETF